MSNYTDEMNNDHDDIDTSQAVKHERKQCIEEYANRDINVNSADGLSFQEANDPTVSLDCKGVEAPNEQHFNGTMTASNAEDTRINSSFTLVISDAEAMPPPPPSYPESAKKSFDKGDSNFSFEIAAAEWQRDGETLSNHMKTPTQESSTNAMCTEGYGKYSSADSGSNTSPELSLTESNTAVTTSLGNTHFMSRVPLNTALQSSLTQRLKSPLNDALQVLREKSTVAGQSTLSSSGGLAVATEGREVHASIPVLTNSQQTNILLKPVMNVQRCQPTPVLSSNGTTQISSYTLSSTSAPAHFGSVKMELTSTTEQVVARNGNTDCGSSKKKISQLLRRGKWTNEEEAYASKLINEFKAGILPLTDGTTLRNFLSKLLNCDPMRISKKFVGNNCIGKQVFRRKVAEMNRLTAEYMQQTSFELSELEQRFLERVATTNRLKIPGVTNISTGVATSAVPASCILRNGKNITEEDFDSPPTPPWLKPPANYKALRTAATVEKMKSTHGPLPHENQQSVMMSKKHKLSPNLSLTAAPLADIAKIETEKMTESMEEPSSALGQLVRAASSQFESLPRTESALEQLARTASAAKFVEDIVNADGVFADTQAKRNPSSLSLQGSFEAIMSMEMNSVENLLHLGSIPHITSESKTIDGSGSNLSSRIESFIRSISNANLKSRVDSSAALSGLLQNIQNSLNDPDGSSSSIFDAEKFMDRVESLTGISKLRAQNGLASVNHNSVEEFLSLVASGDIPHQDPCMLNVPLQNIIRDGSASTLKRVKHIFPVSTSELRNSEFTANVSDTVTPFDAMCTKSVLKKRRKQYDTNLESNLETRI